jgi:hypothetical protein
MPVAELSRGPGYPGRHAVVRGPRGFAWRVALTGLGVLGPALAVGGCGSGEPGVHGGAPGTPGPALVSSAPSPSPTPVDRPVVTPAARALCAAFPLHAVRQLLPGAATGMPYATKHYGPACTWLTAGGTKVDATVLLRRLDSIATTVAKSPVAFAQEQASYPHAVKVPGLAYGTYYDRGRNGTDVEVDWFQDGHNYSLTVVGSTARVPKPGQAVMSAQAQVVAARLRQVS